MADLCVDCTQALYEHTPSGASDLPSGRGWWECAGCGVHVFMDGRRACATPQLRAEARAMGGDCKICLTLARTMR